MRVALIQFDIHWNNEAENQNLLTPLIEKAAEGGARLVVLPEMFNCGFSFLQGAAATKANELGVEFLCDISAKYSLAICGSLPEQPSSGNPFNTLYVANRGEILGQYRKLHLFSFGGEPNKYQRGNQLLTLALDDLNFSFLVCYDLRFPIPFEILGSRTDAFVVVANWPAARASHWRTLLTARAIEQQCYIIGVNRIGEGGDLQYSGDSLCVSPRGELLCDPAAAPGVFFADINKEQILSYRAGFTALKDRLPGLYESLARN